MGGSFNVNVDMMSFSKEVKCLMSPILLTNMDVGD